MTETDVAAPPALPAPLDDRPAFLTRDAPLIDTLPDRWVGYLAATIAQVEDGGPPITRSEVGMFVELCAAYRLDPFAKEAWLAKSKRGKLLVMVGRDGLRKIVMRNGLHLDGDVVRANDTFAVTRSPDGNRTVAHSYGNPAKRGEIVGAWAEVREGGPMGKPMGYFYAPLEEYRPQGASPYSPWSKQVGVMILAAAERQAARQSTPLGGLVAEGENESIEAREVAGLGSVPPGATPDETPADELPAMLVESFARAAALDPMQWRKPEILARIPSAHDAGYAQAVRAIADELDRWLEQNEPLDAVVVSEEPVPDPEQQGGADHEPVATGAEVLDVDESLQKRWREDQEWAEQVGPLLHRLADTESSLDERVGAGDETAAEHLREELAEVVGDLDALDVPPGWHPSEDDSVVGEL